MRFSRLILRAYGRFTDCVLDLPRVRDADLHLVFGANEAGKSTTLNAVTDFLFGFEHHATFAFLHDAQDLRVGASLDTGVGPLHAMRRRGRKQTLFALDADTLLEDTRRPLPDEALASLLAGLDKETYRMLFGLDLDRLVEGGRALVEGQGELGQSLFQAAAGLSVLKQVGDQLDAAADEIYTRAARTKVLNKALGAYVDQGKLIREKSLRTSQWEAAERQCRDATRAHERLQEERRRVRSERDRLQRIKGNLTDLARRKSILAALAPLQDVPRLAPDAEQRRIAAEAQAAAAQQAAARAAEREQRLAEERATLVVDAALLAAGPVVERLDRQTEGYLLARETLAQNAGALSTARRQLRALLDEIAPHVGDDDAASLLPSRAFRATVDALIESRQALELHRTNLEHKRNEKETELAKARSLLADLPETGAYADLAAAIEVLNDLPQIETAVHEQAAGLATERAQLCRGAVELGQADAEGLARLQVPMRADILEFNRDFQALEERDTKLAASLEANQEALHACRQEIRRLEAAGDVVTPLQVGQLREHRDRLWKVVRRMFVEGDGTVRAAAATHGTDKALPEAFERSVAEADRLADLLRADTERATRHADALAQIAELERVLAALAAERTALAREREALDRRWTDVCSALGLRGTRPDGVLEWTRRREDLLQQSERLAARESAFRAQCARREHLRGQLSNLLRTFGLTELAADESAGLAMQRLRHQRDGMAAQAHARDAARARMREIEPELHGLAAELERAGNGLARWEADWGAALARLQLPAAIGRDGARVRLDQFDRLAAAIEALRSAQNVATVQGAIVASFERGVADLERDLGRSVSGLAPELWVRRLYEALKQARSCDERLLRIEQDLLSARQEREQGLRDLELANGMLAAMARDARCELQALADVQRLAAERSRRESQLDEVDRALQLNGRSPEELEAEAAAYDVDGIADALRGLDERILQLDEDEGAARDARNEATRAFAAIDGDAAAAELQQEQAQIAARIQAHARRWSRARLAAAILQRVVQQYRERHQGPLLQRASDLFRAITCGSFAGLTTDYVDDRQILLGERPGGARIRVEGMSKGTCDQLYLALRLATMESHIASRGPIPVVVDDLLVQFDDARSLATLRQLQALSARTQVLFFTHHAHLIDLARETGVVDAPQVHRLADAA